MDFLLFKTDHSQEYAVDIRDLIAVKQIDNITTVPGAVKACVGMFMYFGELIPVVDMSMMYHDSPENCNLAVILQSDKCQKYALLVDSIGSILRTGEVPNGVNFFDAKDFYRLIMKSEQAKDSVKIENYFLMPR